MKKIIGKIAHWESWPFGLLYAPISVCWLWYIIKSGTVWFFTSSNPKITFGGLRGEPKKEMYDLLPKDLYPVTIWVKPEEKFTDVLERISLHQIQYPFVVKPEVGEQGILFRKIDNESQFKNYHQKIPVEYIVQQMVQFPVEVSVFYYRYPGAEKGVITGFLQKIPMQVKGDGTSTLEQLVTEHPKAQKRIDTLHKKHKHQWHGIIPNDETYMLSYAANHNQGAFFVDLKEYVNDTLVSVFDKISLSIDDFFYGRYDILCNSIEEFQQGKNFAIIEFNGCGAEPNHIYDTGYSLPAAYREILKHWKALYEISLLNRKRGIQPWPLFKGWRFVNRAKKYIRKIRQADLIIEH